MNQLQKFQKRYGLVADGIIGQKTLRAFKREFRISSIEKTAHFAAQIVHETGHFQYEQENLNYSAEGLRKTFKRHFKTYDEAMEYAYNPERIANKVYANRIGNGDEKSGDGWKYRGRGAIQLTGKNNYEIFANKMRNLDILSNPQYVASDFYFESALFYFDQNRLWSLCEVVDNDSIIKVTRKINGGLNGLEDRIALTYKFYKMLQVCS
jgi:putative chitinase